MKSNVEIDELINALEEIRDKKYPEIPKELIKSLVVNELNEQDNRVQARKNTKKIVDDFLKTLRNEEVR